MSFKIPKQPLDYKLIGCVEFLSKETLKVMGYNYKNIFPVNTPVLVYSKNGTFEGSIFGELPNGKLKYINPEIVKNIYDLQTAKEEFPELFI